MFTPALAAISRVEAPSNPLAANTSSAVARIRALVEVGASRACWTAVRTTASPSLVDQMIDCFIVNGLHRCQGWGKATKEGGKMTRRSMLVALGAATLMGCFVPPRATL